MFGTKRIEYYETGAIKSVEFYQDVSSKDIEKVMNALNLPLATPEKHTPKKAVTQDVETTVIQAVVTVDEPSTDVQSSI